MTPLRLSMFSALSFVNVFINCNHIGHYLIPLPIRKKIFDNNNVDYYPFVTYIIR